MTTSSTPNLAPDPLSIGLERYGTKLRAGELSVEQATRAYLDRISVLDPILSAYAYIAHDQAIAAARLLDQQLSSGVDLGPLMGVPIAIKDNIMVDGMPCLAGSRTDVARRLNGEASFVSLLKARGCVVLGKLNTVEFALGNTGVNARLGTPRNPWDATCFRLPSGSSSGSAVAVAAGLCAFAIGTDTGGSVRGPAAHCGVFGMKFSAGRWPMDGILPVSAALDALGILTGSAQDAATVWRGLTGEPILVPREPGQIRLGVSKPYFFDNLDPIVETAMQAALLRLAQHGVQIESVAVQNAHEVDGLYNILSKSDLLSVLGQDWVKANADRMNPDVFDRLSEAFLFTRSDYETSIERRRALSRNVNAVLEQVDALLSPTKREVAPTYDSTEISVEYMRTLSRHCAGPTRIANFFDLCGVTLPVNTPKGGLPVGMQLMGGARAERSLLEIALTIERIIGAPARPDLSAFFR